MSDTLRGTGVALITPFLADNSIDYSSLAKLIEHQIDGGVDYLVILGTTGETATISDLDRFAILDFVAEKTAGRIPLVAGFGGNDTAHVIESLRSYKKLDAYFAILSVCPYYNRPNQEGLYLHYRAIAESCDIPIILYNVPSRTGCNLEPATVKRLADAFSHIVGVKEASGDLTQIMEICQQRRDDFLVISGDDIMTLPMMSFGIDGLISVLGNALPYEISTMVRCGLNGELEKARDCHFSLLRMMHLIFEEGNPVGVKALMSEMGLCENALRLPLAKSSAMLLEKIKQESQVILENPVAS